MGDGLNGGRQFREYQIKHDIRHDQGQTQVETLAEHIENQWFAA